MKRIMWIATVFLGVLPVFAEEVDERLASLEQLVVSDPRPFVLVEANGEGAVNRAQGVVISPHGHVVSAGHVSWLESSGSFADQFRVSFRSRKEVLPEGVVHRHKAIFRDHEDAVFFEHYYKATQLRFRGSRYVGKGDLALFQIQADGEASHIRFFSRARPKVRMGETFHLCHYNFPHKSADPTFLISPLEIVGVVQTPFGVQYLAKGYYRVGSSGGAILKDGRLIGIQSAAYTINAKDIGEIPPGLVSFQLVWADLFDELLKDGVGAPVGEDVGAPDVVDPVPGAAP